MSLFDPIKPYLTLLKLAGFAACVIVAFAYGCSKGKADGEAHVRATELKTAQDAAKAADGLRIAAEAQRDRYQRKAEGSEAIAAQYLQELNNANDRADRTVADIRSGYVRLRNEWRCPKVSAPGQAPADPGQPEDDSELRAAGIGRVRGVAASCAAHVKALLDLAECDRGIKEKCRENG